MIEEILPELHEVRGLLEPEIELLRHQEKVVVVYHVPRLLLQTAEKGATHCHHTTVLNQPFLTVASESQTKGRPWLILSYIVIIIKQAVVDLDGSVVSALAAENRADGWQNGYFRMDYGLILINNINYHTHTLPIIPPSSNRPFSTFITPSC